MFKVKWSPLVIAMTIAISLVFLYIDFKLIFGILNSANIVFNTFLLFLINAVILFVITSIPLYVQIEENSIFIKKIGGGIKINYSDIVLVKSFNPAADLRIFGSGGFGGFIGKFSNSDFGWYSSYICNPKQAFIISTKSNKKFAFSCEDHEGIVTILNKKIQ